jgi:myo-inositol 2-dehydrogenase/D-chiro-inositol 1-dehydrogenase
MMRFGLVGAGRIGAVHARNLAASCSAVLVAVTDPDKERARKIVELYGGTIADDFAALLADASIDAVVIASPTTLHSEQVIAAARARKAILCEKPLSLNLDEAKRCGAIVQECGVPFMIALNKRFDPTIAELERRLRVGEVGKIEMISLIGKDPGPPPESFIATSGGIFRDMMVHDIDLAMFLSGEIPSEIWATGAVHISSAFEAADDFDTAAVIMKTPSGLIITQTLSRRATFGFDQRIEVHGAKGMLRTENHHRNHVEALSALGVVRAPLEHSFLERYALSYAAELDHFIDRVASGRKIEIDVDHAILVQSVADRLTDAARGENGKHLPESTDRNPPELRSARCTPFAGQAHSGNIE